MIETNWYLHPAWTLIEKAVHREMLHTNLIILGLSGLIPIGVFFLTAKALFGFATLTIISIVASILLEKINKYYKEILKCLHFHAERIDWVYAVAYQQLPFGLFISSKYRICFACRDGFKFDLEIKKLAFKTVMRFLERIVPDATFGWSQKKEELFNAQARKVQKDQGSDAL